MSVESRHVFNAFREKVFDDYALLAEVHRPLERDAFVAHVVKVGGEGGFVFEADDVRAAMRDGQTTWLTHWSPAL